MAKQLTKEALSIVHSDALTYGQVANAIECKPIYFALLVKQNSKRLTQFAAVKIIADKMGVKPEDILEEKVLATA